MDDSPMTIRIASNGRGNRVASADDSRKYAGVPIVDPFGHPLRLRTAVKLGCKNAKWIKAIEVTNTFRETFRSRQGEN